MRRPTIRDIAKAAGVSSGAVSFALNGRPGVSEVTRQRIIEVADQLGWVPSVAARALSVNRAQALGLLINRPADSVTGEGFYLRFIAGVEGVLTEHGQSLVLQMVATAAEENEIYRAWWSSRRVDGVILTDPREDDPRLQVLRDLGVPAVVVGAHDRWVDAATDVAAVATADGDAMRLVVDHLLGQGRRRIAYVAGISDLLHVQARMTAFQAATSDLPECGGFTTDFTENAGKDVTHRLLTSPGARPDAIVFDNEMLALGGLVTIHALGLEVPDDVALVSFEDSPMCRVVSPPLTALARDPAVLGREAAEALLESLAGQVAHRSTAVPELLVRESTRL